MNLLLPYLGWFDDTFWQGVISNLIATLLGVVIGIPVALWVDRTLTRRRKKEDDNRATEVERARRAHLLQIIRNSLTKNDELLAEMLPYYEKLYIVWFNVDSELLESTNSLKYELIQDLELVELLDNIRFDLSVIHRGVEIYQSAAYSSFTASSLAPNRMEALAGAVVNRGNIVRGKIQQALARLPAT